MGYYIVAISWGSNIGPLCGGFLISSKPFELSGQQPRSLYRRCGVEMAEMAQRHPRWYKSGHGDTLRA